MGTRAGGFFPTSQVVPQSHSPFGPSSPGERLVLDLNENQVKMIGPSAMPGRSTLFLLDFMSSLGPDAQKTKRPSDKNSAFKFAKSDALDASDSRCEMRESTFNDPR